MRVGLFIPGFMDAFAPEVGIATLELLERPGHDVVYPRDQNLPRPARAAMLDAADVATVTP
jgi:Fe-S oxidoreductase